MLADLLVEGGARSDGLGVVGLGRAVQARQGQRPQSGEREKREGQDERLMSRTRRAHSLLLGGERGGSLEGTGPRRACPPDARAVRRFCTKSLMLAHRGFARPWGSITGDECGGEYIPVPADFFCGAIPVM